MAKSIINVLVNLDTKKFNQQLSTTSGKFAKFGGSAVKSMAKVGAAFGGAAVVAGAAFGKIAFSAAETAATSNARIESIANSMGLFGDKADEVSDRLINFAETSARLTGVNQNVIKEGQALLLTFGNIAESADEAGGAFDRATQLTMDLAAAGFGSVTDNAKQLGKALNDPVKGLTALSRSGITFTDEQRNMIAAMVEAGDMAGAQNLILEEMEAQVGGTAEATANASDQISVGFSQITERIGLALLPAFTKLTDFVLKRVIPGIENLLDVFDKDGLSGVFDELRNRVREALPKVLATIRQWGEAVFNWYVGTFYPWLWGQMQRAGAALVDWIEPRIKPTLRKLGEFVASAANWLIDTGLPTLVDKLIELGDALVAWIEPRIQPMLRQLGKLLRSLAEWVVTRALPRLTRLAGRMGKKLIEWAFAIAPEILRGLGGMIVALAGWVRTEGLPKLGEEGGKLFERFTRWIGRLPGRIKSGLWSMVLAIGQWILDNGPRLARQGVKFAAEVVAGIGERLPKVGLALLGALNALRVWITENSARLAARGLQLAVAFLKGVRDKLTDIDTWKSIGRAMLNAATFGLSGLGGVIGGAIGDAFNSVFGGGGGGSTFDDDGPEPMARGGLVMRPTVALVGEAGPEMVIPLEQLDDFTGPKSSNQVHAVTYNVTVNAGVGDPGAIGQQVVETIRAYERRNGAGWRAA